MTAPARPLLGFGTCRHCGAQITQAAAGPWVHTSTARAACDPSSGRLPIAEPVPQPHRGDTQDSDSGPAIEEDNPLLTDQSGGTE